MGLLDGFNHGSTWVLILLVALLAPMKNRPAMLAIAGTFIAVQGIVYFIWLAAWLNLFLLIEISRNFTNHHRLHSITGWSNLL